MPEGTTLTCQHCGATFPLAWIGPRNPKYCSTRCRVAASHLRRKADGRIAAEAKAKREQSAAQREPCGLCGSPLPSVRMALCLAPDCRAIARELDLAVKRARMRERYEADPEAGRARVTAYRSRWSDAAKAATRERHREWIARHRVTVHCAHCDQPFGRHPLRPEVTHCSIRCANHARRGLPLGYVREVTPRFLDLPEDHPERQGACRRCSTAFIKRRSSQSLCGDCPSFVAGWCPQCGDSFVVGWQGGDLGRWCSERCKRSSIHARYIARKRQVYIADVNRAEIFKRDRWVCHLCGKRIKRQAQVPHPLAPTIDHVIPLSVGGTHEPSNCRAAHFRCNSLKGAGGGGEQLMLIG